MSKKFKAIISGIIVLCFLMSYAYAMPLEYISLDGQYIAEEGNNGIFVMYTPKNKYSGIGTSIFIVKVYPSEDGVCRDRAVTVKFSKMINGGSMSTNLAKEQCTNISIYNPKGEFYKSLPTAYPVQNAFSTSNAFNNKMNDIEIYFPEPSSGVNKFYVVIDSVFGYSLTSEKNAKIFSLNEKEQELAKKNIMPQFFSIEPYIEPEILLNYDCVKSYISCISNTPFSEYNSVLQEYDLTTGGFEWINGTYIALNTWYNRRYEYLFGTKSYTANRLAEMLDEVLEKTGDYQEVFLVNKLVNNDVYKRYIDHAVEFLKSDSDLKKTISLLALTEDALAALLANYDMHVSKIESLEDVYTDYYTEALDHDVQKALLVSKGKYSEKFTNLLAEEVKKGTIKGLSKALEKFWESVCNESKKSSGKKASELFNMADFGQLLDTFDIAISFAMEQTGLKQEAEMTEKLSISVPFTYDLLYVMEQIEDKVRNNTYTQKDLKEYYDLFYIVKAVREYQFEAVADYDKTAKKYLEQIRNTEMTASAQNSKTADSVELTSPSHRVGNTKVGSIYTFDNGFKNAEGDDILISGSILDSKSQTALISVSADGNEWQELGKLKINEKSYDLSDYNIAADATMKYVKISVQDFQGDLPIAYTKASVVTAYYAQ